MTSEDITLITTVNTEPTFTKETTITDIEKEQKKFAKWQKVLQNKAKLKNINQQHVKDQQLKYNFLTKHSESIKSNAINDIVQC